MNRANDCMFHEFIADKIDRVYNDICARSGLVPNVCKLSQALRTGSAPRELLELSCSLVEVANNRGASDSELFKSMNDGQELPDMNEPDEPGLTAVDHGASTRLFEFHTSR